MFDVRWLNISVEVWCAAFCAVGIACALLFTRTERVFRNYLVALFVAVLVAAGGDALAGIFRGDRGDLAWIATHAGNLATFCGGFVLLAIYTSYLCARLEAAQAPVANARSWCAVVWTAAGVMCVLTALGAFYHIDADNVYRRTGLYWATLLYALPVAAFDTYLTVRARARLDSLLFACLMAYNVIPVLATVAQTFTYGFNVLIVADMICVLLLFFEIQTWSARILSERSEQLVRSEAELADSRIAAMVSQIQPHFLFNALDSIYQLCEEDPSRAQQAVDMFSSYLRANLASLRRTAPVPIETELGHVRTYLDLEKISMEDLLIWELDVQATGFSVPALSVQTLAENAVRHGVSKKPDGGHITVRTREDRTCWMVSVTDDGVGFDTSAPLGEGHVGLENSRRRIEALCGGTLDITSEPGRGTTAVIRIPKEERL